MFVRNYPRLIYCTLVVDILAVVILWTSSFGILRVICRRRNPTNTTLSGNLLGQSIVRASAM